MKNNSINQGNSFLGTVKDKVLSHTVEDAIQFNLEAGQEMNAEDLQYVQVPFLSLYTDYCTPPYIFSIKLDKRGAL